VKPENILFEAGHAVVCDFGIARAIEIAAAERLTDSGVILGTPAYMSPEQMTREPQIDGRSDVYSVACVLYEMLAGCLPFSRPPGRILFETANANAPQPLSRVRRDVPAGVAQVIDRALARSPDDRFDSVSAFTAALASARAAQATKRRLRKQVIGSGVTVAAVAVAVVSWNSRSLGRATPIERQLTFSGNTSEASLSPDGRFIAYVAQAGDSQNVVVQDVEAGGKAITVYSSSNVGTLDWSPDGTRIVVASYNHPKNSIAIVPRLGGAVQYFSIRPANHAYWLPDGKHLTVYAAGQQRLLIIDSDGGDSTRLTIPGKYTWMWQGNWSPDGRVFALVTEWYNPWKFQILTVSRSGAVQVVAEDSMPLGSPRWSGDGKYLYYGRGTQTIWRVPVSTRTGTRTGEPENVPANLEARVSNLGGLSFSVARAGHHMAYTRGLSFSQVVLVERGSTSKNPRTTQLTTGTAQRWWPVVSPDGRSVAYAEASSGPAELWRMPIEGGTPTQLTNGARVKTFSQTAWGPDGSHIAFETVRGGFGEVWTADVRNGQLRRYAHTSMGMIYSHLEWAPGPDIVYSTPDQFDQQILNPATGDQLVLTSDSRMHVVRGPLQHDQADLGCVESPRYSPDARRLAVLRCDGRGGSSLWLFDLHDSTTTKLADLPGLFPRSWSSDGRYVYAQYQMGGNRITRLDARGVRPPEIFVELPVRGAQCSPAGKLRPNAFVCVVNDFTSDIVLIENFDARG
jgi:Tol biopolymer transport system component